MRKLLSTILLALVVEAGWSQTVPLVYDVENTGSKLQKPVMPAADQLPVIRELPDALEGLTGFADWSRRRSDIGHMIQHYGIGEKPAVKPKQVKARMDGDTLIVDVKVGKETLTLKSTLRYPKVGQPPYALMIGTDMIALPRQLFEDRAIATTTFTSAQVNDYKQFGKHHDRGEHAFDRLYPQLKDNGAYSEWAWGMSRLIDGLQQLGPEKTKIDVKRIGVTGCSYAGKMALYCGAFDERIALTIAQEPGGGGAAAWRKSHELTLAGKNLEDIDKTDYHWFLESQKENFRGDSVYQLPYDQHELCAMVCPRALLLLGNTDYEWLADSSMFYSAKAAYQVWQRFGISDRMSWSVVGGHGHCQLPQSQFPIVESFLDRFLLGVSPKEHQTMASPNGLLNVAVNGENLVVNYQGQKALELTGMGLNNKDFVNWTGPVKNDYWMLTGKRLHCTNEANEYRCGNLVLRVYNDGIAFRYEYSNLQNQNHPDEHTAYIIPEGTKRWMQQWSDGYEGFFPMTTTANVKTLGGFGGSMVQEMINTHWGYPLLIEASPSPSKGGGIYALITEANIERRQSASSLFNDGEVFRVVQDQNDLNLTGDWHTPWRVVIIGKLADIVQSTLVTDVCEPSKMTDTSWIKPGVVSWIYWANNHGSNDYNIIKKYVDMAVALKLPYVLIDAEWDEMDKVASNEGKTIEDAVKYALSKGVKPLIWYNSCIGWVNGAPGPKFRLNKPEDREKEFAWCEKIGVAGVKIDFFSGDNQANMDYCQDLLESAARHHLLVNFHGAPIPRGWQRTYPNLLSTEGVYGAEWYNNVPHFTKKAASHNATLPYTRNVIGPMDYTPCAFSDSQHPHITSNAHELALTVLYESGLQHLADRPESFLSQPQEVQDFLGQLPTVWDETRFVSGYPGESVVLARKSGKTWYVAGINGTDDALTLAIPAGILTDLSAKMTLFADSGNAESPWSITSLEALPESIACQPRGGFIIKIEE